MAQKSIRALTQDEDEFNNYIKKYENYIDFTATEFDYSDEVIELFNIYKIKLQKNYDLELKRGLRTYNLHGKIDEIEIPYGISDELRLELEEHEKNRINSEFKITEKFTHQKYTIVTGRDTDGLVTSQHINEVQDGYAIQNILRIDNLSLATTLCHPIYKNLEPNQYLSPKIKQTKDEIEQKQLEENIDKEQEALRQKIKDWHNYNFGLNRAKDFIDDMYPSWGSKSKRQKEPARKKLYELMERLKIFGIDEFYLIAMKDILETEIALNQLDVLKVKKLLSIELPNINSLKKAEKIIKNYKEPTQII